MGKVVNLTQSNLLPLIDALKENVELDTYMIGGEEDAPVGGRYYHVQNEDDSNIEEDINFDKHGMSLNDDDILRKYNLKDLILSKNGKYVTLNKIVSSELGKGNGSRFMEDLTKLADKNGWILGLTPDTSFGGTSVSRLKKFYKRFGFFPNKGRKADFNTREAMIRRPINENKYDDLFNKVTSDLENFKKQGEIKYGEKFWYNLSWMKNKHPRIEVDPKDIKIYNALEEKSNKIARLWNIEDENENSLDSSDSVDNGYDIISLAIDEFGLTYDLRQCGYILPDGRLLNFGSDGYRETDHRQIAAVYNDNNIKIWNDEYRYNYVVDFMNHGAIRCDLHSGILDMTQEPTNEQYRVLSDFIRRAVDVDIDFTDNKGNTLHSVSYSNKRPQAVIADIRRYYEDGIKPIGNVQYEGKNMNINKKSVMLKEDQLKAIKENLEFEVDSSDIDLSSFKKKTELAPSIWIDGETLDSKIRLKLLDIADDFWEFVNLTWVEPKAIIITGSICNFNWSQYSDIDLHIIVDFNEIDEKTDFVREYLDMKKNDWNNEHENLKIMGFQVELYVQNIDEDVEAGGIYDLEENKWIKKPNEDDLKPIGLNKYDIKNKAAEIMTIIDDMHDALNHTNDAYEIRQIGDDAEHLWKKVKQMRKDSLGKDGEMGLGNIVYKILRREFYLDKLFDLRTAVYDRTNSISEGVSYDAFKSNQSLRYKLIYSMINDGYLFHGNDGEWESFDKSKIKGGSRGIYGYGAYFTNAAYKCEEYGNDFMVLDANNFIFLDIDEKVHKGMNIFKEKENDYHYLNNGLDNARNNNEYDYYATKIDEYNENVDKELLQKFIRLIDNSDDDITYRILNSNVGGYEDISERISMLYLALGYDGFVCGNQFVVFNFDKLNEYLVKDKEGLISKYIDDLNIHESTDGKSSELLLEYLDKDHNIQLYKYFNYWSNKASEHEKVIDIIDNCPYTLVNYLKKIYEQYPDFLDYLEQINGDEDLLYDDTFINEIVNFMDERGLCDHFLSLVFDLADYYELPSWLTMDFNRVVKNEWCIHFGSDSDSISKEGFTGGTPDINRLAYTNAGAQKHQSGYDFAFAINDRSVDYNEYGDEAVIFRTSGVEVYHCGDGQNQVVFWGPNVKNFIPIHQDNGDWVVYGAKGQILVRCGRPSEIAIWATENLPQYRKQIMSGKNGYIPTMSYWDENERKVVRKPYPLYRNESIRKYLTLLKENFINEEVVADGNSEHNPYAKRWRIERDALKNFLNNYGKIMTSKENGKQYKVYYDQSMSELIGYNFCICIQFDPIEMEVGSTPYIRALDKFTNRIFQASFDDRGRDNLMGTSDDLAY